MARDFSKATANYMRLGTGVLGTLLNGAAKISLHAWLNADSFTATNLQNTLFDMPIGTSTGATMRVHDGTDAKLSIGGRSVSTDGFQSAKSTTILSTGVAYACGGVLDISGDTIRVYVNGTQEASTGVTFGNATYTHSAPNRQDSIGCSLDGTSIPLSTASQTDGRLGELAVFTGDIGSAAFAELAAGKSPLRIAVSGCVLVAYMQLLGDVSPEPSLVSSIVGTITGSVPQGTHPTVYGYPSVFTPEVLRAS